MIQSLEPWMSDSDIEKGARWGETVATNLEESRVGIICITPDNLNSPWLNFEAGALSKAVGESLVCPYLHGLTPSDVAGPLAQFQATTSKPDDTLELLKTLNGALGDGKLPDKRLTETFEIWRTEFESKIAAIKPSVSKSPEDKDPERSERELLEEIVERVRAIERESGGRRTLSDDIAYTKQLAALEELMRRSEMRSRSQGVLLPRQVIPGPRIA